MYKIYRHGGNNINNQYCVVFYLRHKKGKALTLGFHSLLVKKVKNKPGFHSDQKKKKDVTQKFKGLQTLEDSQVAVLNYINRQGKMFSLLTLAHLI